MFIKTIAGGIAAVALAGSAQAQVAVSIWTGQPASVTQNATIAAAVGLGAPNATGTVSGINFSTTNSDGITVGQWLGNPAISSTTLDNSYMLFTGQIFLNAGANAFTIAHDDGAQMSIDGISGFVLNTPGPTSPVTTPFTITAPSTGTYTYHLSYGECCDGPAVLQWLYPTGRPVGSVPEPATWAMMLVGFGGIGMAMRRQRRSRRLAQVA